MSIPLVDLVVIVVYLVGVTGVGLLSVRRQKLTGEVYFLAGRALPWGIVGAALITLVLGFSLGVMAFLVDLPVIGDTQLITEGLGVSFMMQAWWGFCICSGIFVIASLLTPAPPREQVEALTWASPWQVIARGRIDGIGDPRVLAGLLLGLMAVLYAVFR